MTWLPIASDIAQLLGKTCDQLTSAQIGALALIRGSAELRYFIDQSEDSLLEVMTAWVRVIDSTCTPELVQELLRSFAERTDPDWLSAYPADDRIANELPAPLVLCGLHRMLPKNHGGDGKAWGYLDNAGKHLAVAKPMMDSIHGWSTGAADPQAAEVIERMLAEWGQQNSVCGVVVEQVRNGVQRREESLDGQRFFRLRPLVLNRFSTLDARLGRFAVSADSRRRFLEYLSSDRFRVAVLGEFKRGKSTLINALVGTPDLMPTDILPCTSTLTEIVNREGERRFEVNTDGPFGTYRISTADEFRRGAGNAATTHTREDAAEVEAAAVPRWRVGVASPFLSQATVAIVDSPGYSEDHARNAISKSEAHRADAAILVFAMTQPASLDELDLIETMRAKAGDVMIALNFADSVPEARWPDVRRHVLNKVRTVTTAIPESRIIPVSALKAEDAMRDGRRHDEWLEKFDALRAAMEQQLLSGAGTNKLRMLTFQTEKIIKESKHQIQAFSEARALQLRNLNDLEARLNAAEKALGVARLAIDNAVAYLSHAEGATEALKTAFWSALPSILDEAEKEKDTWTSDHSVLTSPKKHVKEVAEKAQKSLVRQIEAWMKSTGGKIAATEIQRRTDEACSKLEALAAYIRAATGVDSAAMMDKVKAQTLQDAFPGLSGEVDPTGLAMMTVGAGVVSMVIGYIIADIVLYYVLALVVGFTNPIILAAAVVVAIPASLLGKHLVKSWVRGKVYDKIRDGLRDADAQGKINGAFARALSEVFAKLGDALRSNAQVVLMECHAQQQIAKKDLERFREQAKSSPEAIREETAQLAAEAAAIVVELDALHALVADQSLTLGTGSGSSS